MSQVRVEIVVRRVPRMIGLVFAWLLVPATLACIGLALFIVTRDGYAIIRAALAVAAVVAAFAIGGYALLAVRLARTRAAWITLRHGELTIDHRAIFSRTCSISRQVVSDVRVAGDGEPGHQLEELVTFLLAGVRSAVPADLRSARDVLSFRGARVVLAAIRDGVNAPLLSPLPDLPNVAIRFRTPIELDAVGPGPRIHYRYTGFAPPARGERVRGVMVRVADPRAARAAFRTWLDDPSGVP